MIAIEEVIHIHSCTQSENVLNVVSPVRLTTVPDRSLNEVFNVGGPVFQPLALMTSRQVAGRFGSFQCSNLIRTNTPHEPYCSTDRDGVCQTLIKQSLAADALRY